MENHIKQKIVELALQLKTYLPNQFPPLDGLPGEPSGILIQRRCENVKINPKRNNQLKIFHKRFVLTIALEQNGFAYINGENVPIIPDYGTLIYPFQYHHYILDQSKFLWLVITFELEQIYYPQNLYYCSIKLTDSTYRLIYRLLEVYLENGSCNQLVRRYLNCLLGELDIEKDKVTTKEHSSNINEQIRLFEKINGYICLNLKNPNLSVEKIAHKHGISKSYLYNIFEKLELAFPSEYIRQKRIQQACRLLQVNHFLLSEIAENCGFSSLSTFSRCFKRVTGDSPSDYQKR